MPKRAEEEPEEQEAGAPAWVVTYGDMMSLLLVFFVMLLSFSEIDKVKFKAFMGSMQDAFGVQKLEQLVEIPKGNSIALPAISSFGGSMLDDLNSLIIRAFPGGEAEQKGRGVLLTVPGHLLFNSGKADLKPKMHPYLTAIAELLQKKEGTELQIEGHTDNVPIDTLRFPSNWELSTSRASAVVRYLIEESGVPPNTLSAAGHADSLPLVANDSLENREKNRRVEFFFLERPASESLPVVPLGDVGAEEGAE